MFLVSLDHSMDNLPVRLFGPDQEPEAYEFARTCDPCGEPEVISALQIWDSSRPVCISVVRFEDGKPVKRDVVREFD